MLNLIKKFFLFYVSKFGYNITKKEIIDNSKDPVWVVSKI